MDKIMSEKDIRRLLKQAIKEANWPDEAEYPPSPSELPHLNHKEPSG